MLEPDVRVPDGLDVMVEPVLAENVQTAPPGSRRIMRNGVPVFPRGASLCAPGLDLVNQLRDEKL